MPIIRTGTPGFSYSESHTAYKIIMITKVTNKMQLYRLIFYS